MAKNISRRSFLEGVTAGAVGVTSISVLGACTPKVNDATTTEANQETSAEEAVNYSAADATMDADVVVVGAGGAGMCAAIRASQLGKNVILLEKNPSTGGTSAFTEGVCGIHSRMQSEAGIEIDDLELKLATLDYHHYRSNEGVLENFYAKSGETIDWLMDNGVEFALVRALGPSYPTWHLHANMGLGYVARLAELCEEEGVTVYTETPAKNLIIEDEKVAGIVAQNSDGEDIIIAAPVVILASGGYANNPDMMAELAGIKPEKCLPMGAPGRTGDGIQMATNAGATMAASPGTVMFFGGVNRNDTFGTHMFISYAFEGVLWVNEQGKRFINERFAELQFSHCGNAILQQERTYSIVSKGYLDMIANEGAVVGFDARGVPAGTPLTELYDQINAAMEKEDPGVFYAETLEDLAEQINVPLDTLQVTIEQNNENATNGTDPQYGKDAKFLHELEAPYYAFDLGMGYFCTVGGLKVTPDAQVLDTDFNVIPGLYAAGSDAGGLYGDTYDVSIAAGSQQGWAVTSGRLAAEHAASYLS